MIRSLWTAASGMNGMQFKTDRIAHNLANVNTIGFKKVRADFEDLIYQNLKMQGTTATEKYGTESDGKTLNIRVSREDLASLSSMATCNAIRTLSAFAEEELVILDGRSIAINDEEKLKSISVCG